MEFHRTELATPGARALAWVHDELIDVGSGWEELWPEAVQGEWAARGNFDMAVSSPNDDCVVLAQTIGTKALVLDDTGRVVREINRSFYQAHNYRYPVALFTLPDGRTGLVHCPDKYNILEIEVALTGERLTGPAEQRKKIDFFYSRLAVSNDGTRLLSAGWIWQPLEALEVYDLTTLNDPNAFSESMFDPPDLDWDHEISGACFTDTDVLVSINYPSSILGRWSPQKQWVWKIEAEELGDLVAFAGGALSLNGHPKLYSADNGELIAEWPELDTGTSVSSITREDTFRGLGRVAVSPDGRRFAFTDGDRVVVISQGHQAE